MKKLCLTGSFLFLTCVMMHAQLSGTRWKLTAVYDETNQELLKDAKVKGVLKFTSDSTYSGRLCNSFFGKYKPLTNQSIVMKAPAGTKEFCGAELNTLEKRLYTCFGAANVYMLQENELSLISDKGKLVFMKEN